MTILLQKTTKNPILTISIYDLRHSSQVLDTQRFSCGDMYIKLLDNMVIWCYIIT